MKPFPKSASNAWENRESYVVLTTVSKDGIPNSIYVGTVGRYDPYTFFVANHYFNKTKKNILDNGKGGLLFLTKDTKSYQLKGTLELQDSGPVYEAMKKITPAPYPASVAVLHVAEVYAGAIKLA
jgi:predicted pyridoxine 5'-phosphate oxidase superfamily flavin-nucleotide-binding protein